MNAGPDLDQIIAEKLMRVKPKILAIATNDGGKSAAVIEGMAPFYWRHDVIKWLEEHPKSGYVLGEWKRYPKYSTDLDEAWKVVERLKGMGFTLQAYKVDHLQDPSLGGYTVRFGDYSAHKARPAHAICAAALKVINDI